MKILAIGDFHGKFPEKLRRRIKKENPDLILSNGDYAGIEDWRPLLKKSFKAWEKGKEFDIEKYLGKKRYKKLLVKDFLEGEKVLKEINSFKTKTLSVFGNGDWYKWMSQNSPIKKAYEKTIRKLRHIKNINRSKGNFRGLKIVGFGGYLDSDIYLTKKGKKAIGETEEESKNRRKRYKKWEKELMKSMRKNKPDILLIHYTPYGCLDKLKAKGFKLTGSHMGVSFYNKAIKKYKPSLVVCGHMHENVGTCKIGKTIVINPGAASERKAAVIEFDEKKRKVRNIKFIK